MGITTQIHVKLNQRSYPIYIGTDILSNIPSYLERHRIGNKILIVTNPLLARSYGEQLLRTFMKTSRFDVHMLTIPLEEKQKNLASVEKIYSALAKHSFDRTSSVIALGGGVIGDTVGFAAATYLRGINFIQVPTTLLAQVDSSVGGKTGVDLVSGKNLVGAFYQPKAVFIDVKTLETLPLKELRCGLAEVIKYGMILDRQLFQLLEQKADEVQGTTLSFSSQEFISIVTTCCRLKAHIVRQDEFEKGLRAILNYGHTIGHALEAYSSYKLSHGDAVALGMVAAGHIASSLKVVRPDVVSRQNELIKAFQLPTSLKAIASKKVMEFMKRDKKIRNGALRFVLPVRIGKVKIFDTIPQTLVINSIQRLTSHKEK